jgi:hypothetical protein
MWLVWRYSDTCISDSDIFGMDSGQHHWWKAIEYWRWRRRTEEATVDLIQIARGAETRWSILMGEKTEEDGFPGGILARTTDCWQWGNPSRNALPVNPCLLAGFLHPPSPICCCSAGYTGRVNGYFALLLAGAVYSAMGTVTNVGFWSWSFI